INARAPPEAKRIRRRRFFLAMCGRAMSIPELTGENPAGRTIVSSARSSDFCRIILRLHGPDRVKKIGQSAYVAQHRDRGCDHDRDKSNYFIAEFAARFRPKI